MDEFKFDVGQEVKDKVSGYQGIIMGRSQYLTGCNRYSIQNRKLTKEGKPADWQTFDEDVLIFVGPGVCKKEVRGKKPGGPVTVDAFQMKQK